MLPVTSQITLWLHCYYLLQVLVKMSGEFYMKFVKPKDADPDPILLEAFNVSRGEATISFDT